MSLQTGGDRGLCRRWDIGPCRSALLRPTSRCATITPGLPPPLLQWGLRRPPPAQREAGAARSPAPAPSSPQALAPRWRPASSPVMAAHRLWQLTGYGSSPVMAAHRLWQLTRYGSAALSAARQRTLNRGRHLAAPGWNLQAVLMH